MSTVLLLNATYEPIRVISTRRAVVLVLQEKAEILESGDDEYHSATTAVPVPAVIRLKRFVQIPYRARVPLSNHAVLRRDGFKCAYCPRRATTVDHVVPRSKGGRHVWENVVAACRPCNARKAAHMLSETNMTLSFKPFVPTGTQWLLIGIPDTSTSAAWKPYLEVAAA